MTDATRPPKPPDDEVVYLDDGGDDLASVMAEAERAVAAVEERHKHDAPPEAAGVEMGLEVSDAPPPKPAPAAPSGPDAAEWEKRLAAERERATSAEEEAGRLREALLRKAADFENLKRRTEREKTDYFKFALAETFRDLAGVVDNFDRALAHAGEAVATDDFRVGIEMISRQLADALKKYGLVEIAAQGLPFDPNVHEAVAREETDAVAPGTVLEVFQKGYLLNDRLLRPAMVKVAAARAASGGET